MSQQRQRWMAQDRALSASMSNGSIENGQMDAPSGRRLQQLKLFVVIPLTVAGLMLGVLLLHNSGDLTPIGIPSALAIAADADAATASVRAGGGNAELTTTNSTRKPTMKEMMQV